MRVLTRKAKAGGNPVRSNMLRDITLGQYYQTESVIHRMDPRVKLGGTLLFIISLFFFKNYAGYVIAALFLGMVIRLSKVPFKFMVKGMKTIVMLMMITVVFNLFLTQGTPLVTIWKLTITQEGLKMAISMAVRLTLLIIGSSSIVVTNENEYSLIRQFGKVDHVVSSAGVTFKIPFVQSVDKLPKEILLYDLSSSDVITSDKKTMICDSYILWQINDPLKFAQTLNSSISNAESRLDTIVYNSTKNIISSTTQNDVISGRDGELAAAIMKNIGNTTEQYGIELLSFETKQLDLPSDNKAAVYERMISERENISATYTAEGSSEAQMIRNTTDKEVNVLLSEANKNAEILIAEGEAEYMRVLSEAYADESKQDFYSFVRSLDALKASMTGDNKTVILSPDSPIAQIFYGR